MTREPDRFEVKAQELYKTADLLTKNRAVDVIAAALRAERDAALDEAAKICDEAQAEYWAASRAFDAAGNHFSGAAEAHGACASKRIGDRIRALASPAAAPAAEPSEPAAPAAEGECWSDVHWCAQHGQPLSECTAQGRAGAPATPPSEPIASAPCPGCVCSDTDHRYCPICADAIQDRDELLRECEEAIRNTRDAKYAWYSAEHYASLTSLLEKLAPLASPVAQGKEE